MVVFHAPLRARIVSSLYTCGSCVKSLYARESFQVSIRAGVVSSLLTRGIVSSLLSSHAEIASLYVSFCAGVLYVSPGVHEHKCAYEFAYFQPDIVMQEWKQ